MCIMRPSVLPVTNLPEELLLVVLIQSPTHVEYVRFHFSSKQVSHKVFAVVECVTPGELICVT